MQFTRSMTAPLSTLGLMAAVGCIWALVSIVTALLLIPWLRARARVNQGLAQAQRRVAWLSATRLAADGEPTTR